MRPTLHHLGLVEYEPTSQAMAKWTLARTALTPDQFWILEHYPVFTQGLAGKPEHLILPTDIPVVPTDRGGQITYHGPGQLVVYPLIHFKRLKIGVRDLVCRLENAIILTLAEYGIVGVSDRDAPGVYVAGKKIASLGLRIKNGCVYHGLSLNVAMDLRPYAHINPCGYAGLDVTDLRSEIQGSPNPDVAEMTVAEVAERLVPHLLAQLYAEKTA